MPYRVVLKKKEEKRIVQGHPWVYANEVLEITGEGRNGDLAGVFSSDGTYIGKGYINHLSKILVRIFIRDNSFPDVDFYVRRISQANAMREKLGFTAEAGYRAVFGESDGLPGLIVDRYGDLLCVQLLTLGTDRNRDIIVEALKKVFSPRGIYARNDVPVREKEGLKQTKEVLYGEFDPVTTIVENGLKMRVDLENGQKTGYFLDQKENRLAIRRYAKGASVLDCFSNVGGFSVNAAEAGARDVTAVDISERALDEVRLNAELNGFEKTVNTVCGDVFDVLKNYRKEGRSFDLVILDPPAFCKSRSDVKNALFGYKNINAAGLRIVSPGGFLVTSSCSHFVSFDMFENMLREAAAASNRTVRVVETRTQAPDHASLLAGDESTYLKFFVLAVD